MGFWGELKRILIIGACALGSLVVLAFVFTALSPQPDVATKIKRSCERQFPGDELQQNDCRIALMSRVLLKAQDDKLAAAARDADVH